MNLRAPLSHHTRDAYIRRLQALTPQHVGRWGRLTPLAAVAHLRRAIEVSLDNTHDVPDVSTALSRSIIRWVAIHTPMPWPKGRAKVPAQLLPEPQGDLEYEQQQLIATLQRFLETVEARPNAVVPHPLFGPMSMKTWARLHGRHLHHHLSQFGV